ncbi:cyclic nucleotide-binding domain-containing protein [Vibrio sp. V27_P1S3P104]|uniref:ATP-binding protein n=1 Tax=Vibrio TaxID=662 RepID=UPI000C1682F5|nr:ATP-binding protein [Vibrio fujianensis]NAW67935.1 cyclic nucleotide-binding domain-containing protein [Vibrio sp. V28_P6S34P95]NAX04894.1 cyclic nucleotide-binding domain-containing protein [Vibrio sp. V30_P3S12P165]NAX35577.1 cyclic nucleotide-binding domain-containing protein [Vibrio sp. V29_P1S30P107]NAX36493.1 cyclic nucleotide-binding domain-containing protein [Vibrio sp. V27_P1S3P104]NAX39625.1 cyclic nucleotide-binding domain-containing protein [Vibrio sp. V26_P1S5P106]
MNSYALLCLDNNPVSVEQWRHELSAFITKFDLYTAESFEEADQALEFIEEQNQIVALVIASHHQHFDGANFLVQLDKLAHTKNARKILISCGQDIQAILNAVNEGRLDYCLTKPLQDNVLYKTVFQELTNYILQYDKDNILSYSTLLDQTRILRAHIDNKMHLYREGFISDYHRLTDHQLAEQVIGALRQFFAQADETRACRTYSAEHLLTKEGEANQFLWFITAGEVALYKKDEQGQQREVVRHTKGNLVGGMSFVTGEPSFSTAITLTKTEVIKLDRDVFAKVMHNDTQLLPLFTNLLLRHFNRRLQRSINTKLQLQKTIESLELAHQQLIESEKMAVLGQLVAGVAHELNNPVAAILRGSDTLRTHLNQLICHKALQPLEQKGVQLLGQALQVNPMSTAKEREKAKTLEQHIHHRLLAKKMVKLGLENDHTLRNQVKNNPQQAEQDIEMLERYYLVGSNLRSIQVCAQRIADMVKSLKSYARPDDETFHLADIHEGLEDTLIIFENHLKRHTVEKHYGDIPPVLCLPIALQQVWTNLISNAIEAFPEHGSLTIKTELQHDQETSYVVVSFTDNGNGIPPERQQQIFALNYTTKREGHFGLGIGLSICQQIVHQHRGWIAVDSQVNKYTTMQVWLPTTSERI